MTVAPQQYTLHCVYSGFYYYFRWYYNNSELNCGSPQNGFSCDINPTPNQNIGVITIRSLFTLTVTWYGEEINSGIFSQSNNNGDHVHRCYVRTVEIKRNRYLTVTGKYFYYYSYMISYKILSAPGFIPSLPTLVNKTATTIAVSWTSVPSDADGYVINATSDTHTVTQQVKGGSQNKMTLKGLIPGTTYNITVRAYQDILGPASNVISVKTLSGILISIKYWLCQINLFRYFINQLDSCLIHY